MTDAVVPWQSPSFTGFFPLPHARMTGANGNLFAAIKYRLGAKSKIILWG
ncbi:UNVERIFIED_ORG: hypothetical protein QOE_2558 [Clostridioides difficile F501]